MAEPVPEPAGEPEPPAPSKRPVLSPDPELAWRPRRRVPHPREHRPLWRLETHQFVLALMVIVAVIMLLMFGMLVSSFLHAVHSSKG